MADRLQQILEKTEKTTNIQSSATQLPAPQQQFMKNQYQQLPQQPSQQQQQQQQFKINVPINNNFQPATSPQHPLQIIVDSNRQSDEPELEYHYSAKSSHSNYDRSKLRNQDFNEIANLNNQIKQQQATISSLNSQLNEKQLRINQMQDLLALKDAQISELKEQIVKQQQRTVTALTSAQLNSKRCESETDSLLANIRNLDLEREELRQQNLTNQNIIENLKVNQQKYFEILQENKILQEKLLEAERRNLDYQPKVAFLTEQFDLLKESIKNSNNNDISLSKKSNSEKQNILAELNQYQKQYQLAKEQLQSNSSELEAKRRENEEMKKNLQLVHQQYEELWEQYNLAINSQSSSGQKGVGGGNMAKNNQQVTNQNSSLNTTPSINSDQKNKIQTQYHQQYSQRNCANKSEADQTNVAELKRDIDRKNKELDFALTRIRGLSSKNSELEQALKEVKEQVLLFNQGQQLHKDHAAQPLTQDQSISQQNTPPRSLSPRILQPTEEQQYELKRNSSIGTYAIDLNNCNNSVDNHKNLLLLMEKQQQLEDLSKNNEQLKRDLEQLQINYSCQQQQIQLYKQQQEQNEIQQKQLQELSIQNQSLLAEINRKNDQQSSLSTQLQKVSKELAEEKQTFTNFQLLQQQKLIEMKLEQDSEQNKNSLIIEELNFLRQQLDQKQTIIDNNQNNQKKPELYDNQFTKTLADQQLQINQLEAEKQLLQQEIANQQQQISIKQMQIEKEQQELALIKQQMQLLQQQLNQRNQSASAPNSINEELKSQIAQLKTDNDQKSNEINQYVYRLQEAVKESLNSQQQLDASKQRILELEETVQNLQQFAKKCEQLESSNIQLQQEKEKISQKMESVIQESDEQQVKSNEKLSKIREQLEQISETDKQLNRDLEIRSRELEDIKLQQLNWESQLRLANSRVANIEQENRRLLAEMELELDQKKQELQEVVQNIKQQEQEAFQNTVKSLEQQLQDQMINNQSLQLRIEELSSLSKQKQDQAQKKIEELQNASKLKLDQSQALLVDKDQQLQQLKQKLNDLNEQNGVKVKEVNQFASTIEQERDEMKKKVKRQELQIKELEDSHKIALINCELNWTNKVKQSTEQLKQENNQLRKQQVIIDQDCNLQKEMVEKLQAKELEDRELLKAAQKKIEELQQAQKKLQQQQQQRVTQTEQMLMKIQQQYVITLTILEGKSLICQENKKSIEHLQEENQSLKIAIQQQQVQLEGVEEEVKKHSADAKFWKDRNERMESLFQKSGSGEQQKKQVLNEQQLNISKQNVQGQVGNVSYNIQKNGNQELMENQCQLLDGNSLDILLNCAQNNQSNNNASQIIKAQLQQIVQKKLEEIMMNMKTMFQEEKKLYEQRLKEIQEEDDRCRKIYEASLQNELEEKLRIIYEEVDQEKLNFITKTQDLELERNKMRQELEKLTQLEELKISLQKSEKDRAELQLKVKQLGEELIELMLKREVQQDKKNSAESTINNLSLEKEDLTKHNEKLFEQIKNLKDKINQIEIEHQREIENIKIAYENSFKMCVEEHLKELLNEYEIQKSRVVGNSEGNLQGQDD